MSAPQEDVASGFFAFDSISSAHPEREAHSIFCIRWLPHDAYRGDNRSSNNNKNNCAKLACSKSNSNRRQQSLTRLLPLCILGRLFSIISSSRCCARLTWSPLQLLLLLLLFILPIMSSFGQQREQQQEQPLAQLATVWQGYNCRSHFDLFTNYAEALRVFYSVGFGEWWIGEWNWMRWRCCKRSSIFILIYSAYYIYCLSFISAHLQKLMPH